MPYPFKTYEKHTDQIRAVQITQDNYRHICRIVKCVRVETTIITDNVNGDSVTFKFMNVDGDVKHTFQENDYLILGESKNVQIEVVKPNDFEREFREPLVHLTRAEYEEFRKMREDWYTTSRPTKN